MVTTGNFCYTVYHTFLKIHTHAKWIQTQPFLIISAARLDYLLQEPRDQPHSRPPAFVFTQPDTIYSETAVLKHVLSGWFTPKLLRIQTASVYVGSIN